MKRALITGITGQDGSYLCELLLAEGYTVAGFVEGTTAPAGNAFVIPNDVEMILGDLRDSDAIAAAVRGFKPTEVYNLAAMSFVGASFQTPVPSCDVTAMGALRLIEAVRNHDTSIRFFQASSAEMYGEVESSPQDEMTAMRPRSPYGVAKLFAHQMVVAYRASYDMYACSGILFNHESPRRGFQFVTRKITDGVARIKHGLQNELALGNLDTARDWGFAGDYVRAMHMMLQQETPRDFVVASGTTHTLREFLDAAFSSVGLTWSDHVVVDPRFFRPTDITTLCGDTRAIRDGIGWQPETRFEDLVAMMVDADIARVATEVGSAPA